MDQSASEMVVVGMETLSVSSSASGVFRVIVVCEVDVVASNKHS